MADIEYACGRISRCPSVSVPCGQIKSMVTAKNAEPYRRWLNTPNNHVISVYQYAGTMMQKGLQRTVLLPSAPHLQW